VFRRAALPFVRAALATLFVAGATCAALPGCSGDPARAPTILRPLDEPHAVSVMARVFRELGLEPVRNRVIQFGSGGNTLTLDVAGKNRRFGIAYITWQDADKLGDDLPKRGDTDAIVVVHGAGADDDVHAALLFAADYMQDDLSGERHTSGGALVVAGWALLAWGVHRFGRET
jgi:hypothetical protein